jgi:hypothetical protein
LGLLLTPGLLVAPGLGLGLGLGVALLTGLLTPAPPVCLLDGISPCDNQSDSSESISLHKK